MKPLSYAIAGLAFSAGIAHAAPKKAAVWFSYVQDSQVCQHRGNPADVIAMIRRTFHTQPEVTDDADDNGTVTSTVLQWPAEIPGQYWTVRMFRNKADCDAYAADQRTDTSKYQ